MIGRDFVVKYAENVSECTTKIFARKFVTVKSSKSKVISFGYDLNDNR